MSLKVNEPNVYHRKVQPTVEDRSRAVDHEASHRSGADRISAGHQPIIAATVAPSSFAPAPKSVDSENLSVSNATVAPRPSVSTVAADARLTDALVDIKTVCATVGACRASIYVWMRKGLFPRPIRMGERRSAWRASEIQAWMDSRPRA